MIERSFDKALLLEVTKDLRHMVAEATLEEWWANPSHLMFVEGKNVGLATCEYPGVYTVHWYFDVRGRDAIRLAQRMVKNLFENYDAKAIRGLTRVDMKAARWAARQVGMKSMGFVTHADGVETEIFCATKEEFLEGLKKHNG